MQQTFTNTRALIGGKLKDNVNITTENGKIVAVGEQKLGKIVDCAGKICCAGYIDVHTHGGWGKDCMQATPQTIDIIGKYHLSTGVTSFAPTTMTASPSDINRAVDNLRRYNGKYSRPLGAHLEGPYLSAAAAGAHPKNLLLNPVEENQSFVWENIDAVSRITLAPNLVGSAEFCKKASERGIQVSLGHDNSIDDEINACVDAGATSVTHMYNCTSRPSRRQNPKKHLGLTEIGLIDNRLVCEVIADNRHVPNALFGMIYKLKGWQNICL
ncbi:MAG: amidohydrolase family protein, partial [Clostridia bacterium]